MKSKPIAIIGAGVIGITTGIKLLQAGYAVTVFARDDKTNMASYAAAAFWCPFFASPEAKVRDWATRSLAVYKTIPAAAGVSPILLTEYYREKVDLPLWAKIISNHRQLNDTELLNGYVIGFSGWVYRVDSCVFMSYLIDHFKQLGGRFIFQEVQHIDDIDSSFSMIVNCSGVWSSQLVPDKATYPIRGQYLIVKAMAGIDSIKFGTVNDDFYTLVVPRVNDCYIGGTTLQHDWNGKVDEKISHDILMRAQSLEPLLKNAQVIGSGVGFRPGRHEIRLEREQLKTGRMVIHNYGHGGSGFTTAWGCAEDVLSLVDEENR